MLGAVWSVDDNGVLVGVVPQCAAARDRYQELIQTALTIAEEARREVGDDNRVFATAGRIIEYMSRYNGEDAIVVCADERIEQLIRLQIKQCGAGNRVAVVCFGDLPE